MEQKQECAADPALHGFAVFIADVERLLSDSDTPYDTELGEEGVVELLLELPPGVSFTLAVDGSRHCRSILSKDGYEIAQRVCEFDDAEELADWITSTHEAAI